VKKKFPNVQTEKADSDYGPRTNTTEWLQAHLQRPLMMQYFYKSYALL